MIPISCVKNKISVNKVFHDMDFGLKDWDCNMPMVWIEKNKKWIEEMVRYCGKTAHFESAGKVNFNDSVNVIRNYSHITNEDWLNIDKYCRTKTLERLAIILEQKIMLFSQIDAIERNIPVHDIIQHDIPYFLNYFKLSAFMPLQMPQFFKRVDWNPDKIEIVSISNIIPFHEICWNIVPYLVSGCTVRITVNENAALLILLFIKLCEEVGIPKDILILESITSVTNSWTADKSGMLLFDGVDLNCAVDAIIDRAWSHNGLVPWSIKKVFVQEAIYEDFIKKILKRIKELKFGNVFDRLVTFGKALNSKLLTDLAAIVHDAESDGLQVYQPGNWDKEHIFPVMILSNCQDLFEKSSHLPVVMVETFSNLHDSIKLIKESKFISSISVWTDSHLVLRKATSFLLSDTSVKTVWLNSHGILDPHVPYVLKEKPHSIKEDFLSFIFKKAYPDISVILNPKHQEITSRISEEISNDDDIMYLLSGSQKAQSVWHKYEPLKRLSILSSFVVHLLDQKAKFESFFTNETLESLADFVTDISFLNRNLSFQKFITINPINHGVILVYLPVIKNLFNFIKLLITYIVYGNSIIVITKENEKLNKFFDVLKLDFPANLVSIRKCDENCDLILSTEEIDPSLEVLASKAHGYKVVWSLDV